MVLARRLPILNHLHTEKWNYLYIWLAFYGYHQVIPGKIRGALLKELCQSYPVISKINSLAPWYIWWTCNNSDIVQCEKSSVVCQDVSNSLKWSWHAKGSYITPVVTGQTASVLVSRGLGISGRILRLIQSFLSNREMMVLLNDHFSILLFMLLSTMTESLNLSCFQVSLEVYPLFYVWNMDYMFFLLWPQMISLNFLVIWLITDYDF